MKPFLVLGHRGSPRRFRENTIASLAAALDEGADGFETDLRMLCDGAAVLFHDERIGRKPIEEMTAGELATHAGDVARVDEMLGRFLPTAESGGGPGPFLDLEVKVAGWERELLGLLNGRKGLVVSSFHRQVIETLRSQSPPVDLGFITRERRVVRSDEVLDLGVRWFFPRFDVVDAPAVRNCREAGIGVIPWSPDRVEEWNRLFDIGCDGMITDLPREAVLWRKGRG